MKMAIDRNKAKGMLWGLIAGDALGSPIQFGGKDAHPWITEMEPCPTFGMPAGCWTDDGSMAMCVMDSFVRKGGYFLKDIGETFCKWLFKGYLSSKEGRAFDVGCATQMSVAAIAHGSLKNGTENSQGNGSIMRFAPSYLIARALGRPEIVHEVSDLTHASKRVREVADRFAGILDEHLAGRRTTAVSAYRTREEVDNSGWAVSTLEAALWAFETTETFEAALVSAVNLGGDSDSIGAVCGQIAGAYYGFDALPERWVKAVKTWTRVDEQIEKFLDVVEIYATREEPWEKYELCDGYVDFGPLHRGMWLTDEAIRRTGKAKPAPEEISQAEDAITPEERHRIYFEGIVAAGKTEDEAEDILKREACGGVGEDSWEDWYIGKLVSEGVLDAAEWG